MSLATRVRAALLAAATVIMAKSAVAAEPVLTKEECIAASESGQDLRHAGKLGAARAQFAICAASSCPGPVREDCGQRLDEIGKAMPSVVFEVKDSAGKDVPRVAITVDGQPLTVSAGTAVELDPGLHTFTVTAPGSDERSVTIDLREGEKKEIEVAPGPRKPASPTAERSSSTIAPPPEAPRTRSNTLGIAIGGIGVAGIGVAIVTGVLALGKKSTADANCNDQLRTCNQEGKDADSAGRSLMTISTIGWVVGVAGLAGAGAYFVLAGTGDEKPKTALGTAIVPGGATATLSRDW